MTIPDDPILEEAHWFWPLVLIPYSIERAHTRTFTGREVAKDIKTTMSRVRLVLDGQDLTVIGRVTGRNRITIPRSSIISVTPLQRQLIQIRFGEAQWSALARAMTSGQPAADRNTILLNTRRRDDWLQAINAPTHPEGPA